MAASTFALKLATIVCCILGFIISLYAFHVETSKEHDANYQAMCDIQEGIMCSKVLTSRWSRGFGLVEKLFGNDSILNQPNPIYGLAFYTFQISLTFSSTPNAVTAQTIASLLANCGSVYLASILYFVLHDLCIVCVTMYVINAALLVCNVLHLRQLSRDVRKKRR